MFKSMRATILFFAAGLVIVTTAGITFFAQKEVTKSVYQTEWNSAQALLNSTMLNVTNEYQTEKAAISRRKEEMKSIVEIAYEAVSSNYKKYKKGLLTEKEAKNRSIEQVKNMRYNDGIGYVWINDTLKPIPRMVMHPLLPELSGKILDNERFTGPNGVNNNIMSTFRDIAEKNGDGYVDTSDQNSLRTDSLKNNLKFHMLNSSENGAG